MNGLELCKKYYEEVGRPAIEKACPEIIGRAAFGLVGEGSECFGFDDEISRDHDWGPGFCIWLSYDDSSKYGQLLSEVYDALPKEFMGFERLRQSDMTSGRVGVMTVSGFYEKYTGLKAAPDTVKLWRFLDDHSFALVTNGAVWDEGDGEFVKIRKEILNFYPEDVRLKRISMNAALAAQSGQYNFYRCQKRGDKVACSLAKAQFSEAVINIVFLLNLRFCPYYKWSGKALEQLPILGAEIAALLKTICDDALLGGSEIEQISALLIKEFGKQNMSHSGSDFLMDHAFEIKEKITDSDMRNSHILGQ